MMPSPIPSTTRFFLVSVILTNTAVSQVCSDARRYIPDSKWLVGEGPMDAILADLDGDGELDLAAVVSDRSEVVVRLGLGDGTFGIQKKYTVDAFPFSLACGCEQRW